MLFRSLAVSVYFSTTAINSIKTTENIDYPVLDRSKIIQNDVQAFVDNLKQAVGEGDKKALDAINENAKKVREKLKKLEDKDIDCGASTSFVERTQNTFLAHTKGISFYFTSDKKDAGGYGAFHYVPVLVTWAELKAFLVGL